MNNKKKFNRKFQNWIWNSYKHCLYNTYLLSLKKYSYCGWMLSEGKVNNAKDPLESPSRSYAWYYCELYILDASFYVERSTWMSQVHTISRFQKINKRFLEKKTSNYSAWTARHLKHTKPRRKNCLRRLDLTNKLSKASYNAFLTSRRSDCGAVVLEAVHILSRRTKLFTLAIVR